MVRFDVDQLVDYRSRRPPLRFETDHWEHYSAPELDVVALTDTGGTGYLLLTGPEPDTQWERFAAAVEELVRTLDVRLVVNLTGIPMAVPHTRPIGVTVHGTQPELTEGHEALFATAEVPGSAVALVEYRLGQAGHAAMGFAVHVPHYLARAEYPQAARVLVDHLAVATGLYLPTEALTTAAERAEREIAEQVDGLGGGRAGGGGAGAAVRHGDLRRRRAAGVHERAAAQRGRARGGGRAVPGRARRPGPGRRHRPPRRPDPLTAGVPPLSELRRRATLPVAYDASRSLVA